MDYHDVTTEELARIVENGMGLEGFKNLAASLPKVGVKHDKRVGLLEMLLNMISQEDLEKLQAGEASIKIKEVLKSLFNSTSRVIPPRGFKPSVTDENREFYLDNHLNDDDCLKRMQEYLPGYVFPSLVEFQDKCGAVKEKALKHLLIGPNAFNRCHLPLPIPHIPELADINQLGQVLEGLLEAVGRAYKNEFSKRTFYNHREGTLTGNVSIVPGTRHKQLTSVVSKAPQAGILLPNSLQGYSIEADRAIISLFPDFVSLVGLESILGMIAYPSILARDYNTPGSDLAAFSWRSTRSLHFEAHDDELVFDSTDYLAVALGNYSGGLFFLG